MDDTSNNPQTFRALAAELKLPRKLLYTLDEVSRVLGVPYNTLRDECNAQRPYAPPYAAVAVEAEDVLCCLGLHPHISASDWLVINLDEVSELIELIRPVPVTGSTSDGYHTFDELYHHRAVLFSVIVAMFRGRSWKSLHHHDGTMYDGMFIVGIDTPAGPATYHYDVEPYWDMFPCEVLERAPEWDGHTPDDAIERIGTLRDLLQAEAKAENGGDE